MLDAELNSAGDMRLVDPEAYDANHLNHALEFNKAHNLEDDAAVKESRVEKANAAASEGAVWGLVVEPSAAP